MRSISTTSRIWLDERIAVVFKSSDVQRPSQVEESCAMLAKDLDRLGCRPCTSGIRVTIPASAAFETGNIFGSPYDTSQTASLELFF